MAPKKPDIGTTGLLFVDPPDGFEPQEHSATMRDTSQSVFNQIKSEGLLTRMRWAVYELLFEHGPLTGSEIDEWMRTEGGRGHEHKRLSELKRVGVAREVRKRLCTVTGRFVYEWDVTSKLPVDDEGHNIPNRYVIVTDGLDEDFYYHLVSPDVWELFLAHLEKTDHHSIASALDSLFPLIYGDDADYDELFSEDDPSSEVILFLECKDVFSWCYENNVKVIGGRN